MRNFFEEFLIFLIMNQFKEDAVPYIFKISKECYIDINITRKTTAAFFPLYILYHNYILT